MKLVCKQVINELLGAVVDFGKVQRLVPRDKGFSTSDIRAALAAMNFVLRQATINAVTHDVLNRELQQLGLPKENSDGISRPFRNNRDLLMRFYAASSLAVSLQSTSLDLHVVPMLHACLRNAPTAFGALVPFLAATSPTDNGLAC